VKKKRRSVKARRQRKRRLSRKVRRQIARKIRFLIRHEGYGAKQAAAIAYSMAGVARPRKRGAGRR